MRSSTFALIFSEMLAGLNRAGQMSLKKSTLETACFSHCVRCAIKDGWSSLLDTLSLVASAAAAGELSTVELLLRDLRFVLLTASALLDVRLSSSSESFVGEAGALALVVFSGETSLLVAGEAVSVSEISDEVSRRLPRRDLRCCCFACLAFMIGDASSAESSFPNSGENRSRSACSTAAHITQRATGKSATLLNIWSQKQTVSKLMLSTLLAI
mmetsp:Transcript_49485/g.124418  ORF Transcript_49485/g.124418 Transcript_49485/m.124418 type:complete len:214 (-) Transcript_49485:441-1082(-)